MENFTHQGNNREPAVNLDAEKGLVEITGRSVPEYATAFYKPILQWVEEYVKNPAGETTVNYKLEYYNNSTIKYLLYVLRCFTPLHKAGKKVMFNWYYEEDDYEAEDAGVLYGELSELPVNLLKYDNGN